jgi:hypothetical protein
MVPCPRCKFANTAGTRFCTHCGLDLQSDLDKFLTRHSLNDISSSLHKNDISTFEHLLSLTDGDLGEIGLAVGDQLRLRKAIRALQDEPNGSIALEAPEHGIAEDDSHVHHALNSEQSFGADRPVYRGRKTMSAAFLWALFLGPFGIFYYSWKRAVATLVVVVIVWLLAAPILPDGLWGWLAVWSGIPCAAVVLFGLGSRNCG